jgi:DNA polymerase-3 subunit epsilon
MSLRLRMLLFFALIACGALASTLVGLWLAARRAPDAMPALVTAGLVAVFGTILVTVMVWLLFDENVARAIDRLSAALRARTHGGVSAGLDIEPTRHLGDLGPAAAALCDRLAREQAEGEARLAEATQALEDEKAHLSAILSEIPVAIMVVDERRRITLYDRQCVHVLGQVSTLCLGRSVFEYLEPAPLEDALAKLAKAERRNFIDAELPTADGSGAVRARIRPAAQGRGFMLAMEVDEEVTAERPLVFDFGLIESETAADIASTPLSALAYVVFDTETTGLDPRADEIVQIGAVRALNGRLVSGETYDTYVDPGRPIPPVSSRVHGVTDELVAGAPDVPTAIRTFHGFARDAVLVAHNAPFDMAFLKRREGELDLAFDNPVLDTVLLSAAVFGETEEHTLDAIAERLDVRIEGAARHTAMGDAVATASVLLKLLPILEARGIATFGDAVAAMRRHERLLPDLNA